MNEDIIKIIKIYNIEKISQEAAELFRESMQTTDKDKKKELLLKFIQLNKDRDVFKESFHSHSSIFEDSLKIKNISEFQESLQILQQLDPDTYNSLQVYKDFDILQHSMLYEKSNGFSFMFIIGTQIIKNNVKSPEAIKEFLDQEYCFDELVLKNFVRICSSNIQLIETTLTDLIDNLTNMVQNNSINIELKNKLVNKINCIALVKDNIKEIQAYKSMMRGRVTLKEKNPPLTLETILQNRENRQQQSPQQQLVAAQQQTKEDPALVQPKPIQVQQQPVQQNKESQQKSEYAESIINDTASKAQMLFKDSIQPKPVEETNRYKDYEGLPKKIKEDLQTCYTNIQNGVSIDFNNILQNEDNYGKLYYLFSDNELAEVILSEDTNIAKLLEANKNNLEQRQKSFYGSSTIASADGYNYVDITNVILIPKHKNVAFFNINLSEQTRYDFIQKALELKDQNMIEALINLLPHQTDDKFLNDKIIPLIFENKEFTKQIYQELEKQLIKEGCESIDDYITSNQTKHFKFIKNIVKFTEKVREQYQSIIKEEQEATQMQLKPKLESQQLDNTSKQLYEPTKQEILQARTKSIDI